MKYTLSLMFTLSLFGFVFSASANEVYATFQVPESDLGHWETSPISVGRTGASALMTGTGAIYFLNPEGSLNKAFQLEVRPGVYPLPSPTFSDNGDVAIDAFYKTYVFNRSFDLVAKYRNHAAGFSKPIYLNDGRIFSSSGYKATLLSALGEELFRFDSNNEKLDMPAKMIDSETFVVGNSLGKIFFIGIDGTLKRKIEGRDWTYRSIENFSDGRLLFYLKGGLGVVPYGQTEVVEVQTSAIVKTRPIVLSDDTIAYGNAEGIHFLHPDLSPKAFYALPRGGYEPVNLHMRKLSRNRLAVTLNDSIWILSSSGDLMREMSLNDKRADLSSIEEGPNGMLVLADQDKGKIYFMTIE